MQDAEQSSARGAHDGSSLALAGTYRREVAASLARVWENVHDWEHLPALHGASFAAAELLERGAWGWRVRLVAQPGDARRAQVIELRVAEQAHRYCVTTLEGPGRGSEIRVRLTPRAAHTTGVVVELHVPGLAPERLARVGERFVELYTRLWDEDEAMMVARERACAGARARRDRPPGAPPDEDLGTVAEVRARLPLRVEFGGAPFRVVAVDGTLLAHAATCPHWLGPLGDAPLDDGCVRCPWHGYRFDVRTGASADGRRLRLATPPRVMVEDGRVVLRAAAAADR